MSWGSFTANVIDAKVSAEKATFTAKLTSSTYRWANVGDTRPQGFRSRGR